MSGKKMFSSAMVIVTVMFGTLAIGEPSQAAVICTNQGDNVNIRSGPGQRYRVVGSVGTGEYVQRLGRRGTWVYVNAGGVLGYIRGDFICGR